MARLSPAELSTECFGLYALSGTATTIAGPILMALLTEVYASQRAGLATVPAFLEAGFPPLLTVREADRHFNVENAAWR